MPGRCNKDRSTRQRVPATPPASRQDPGRDPNRTGSGDTRRLEQVLHDVNNLLTVIVGSLDDLCALGPFDPIVCERINEALEAALRGTELAGRFFPLPGDRLPR